MNTEDFKYESRVAVAVKEMVGTNKTKSKGLGDIPDEYMADYKTRVSFPSKDDIEADYTKINPISATEENACTASIEVDVIENIRQKIASEDYQAEQKAREETDCVLNLKRQFDAVNKKIENFGVDIIRTVVAHYLVNDPMHSSKVKVERPHQKLIESALAHLPLKSGELKVLDDYYMVYQPEYIESLHSTPPKHVFFRIPEKFFPSIVEASNMELELSLEGKKLEFLPSVGDVRIDIDQFFKNYYLAKNANTGTFRIPFHLTRPDTSTHLNFNVKIKLPNSSAYYCVLDEYKDFELSYLIDLAKENAKETVMGLSNYVARVIELKRAQKNLEAESKLL